LPKNIAVFLIYVLKTGVFVLKLGAVND